MCSDKEHSEVTAHFINEEWLTNELIEELMHFTPVVYKLTADINKSATDYQTWFSRCCQHVFYKGRPFTNYRQLDQYASLFVEAWKSENIGMEIASDASTPRTNESMKPSVFRKENKRYYHLIP